MPKWEKYNFPPTMLDVERQTKKIGLSSEQIDQIWLGRIKTKIENAALISSRPGFRRRDKGHAR